jgi:hypothetical protein
MGLIFPTYERYLVIMNSKAIYFELLLKVLYLLLGVVIEGKRIVKITKKKSFKINWSTLVSSLILIVISSLSGLYVLWFGWGPLMEHNPLLHTEINSILTVLAGILLVRSLNKSEHQ